ncbi:MAG: peptidoglycan-binding protein [Clostridia bacterium]|nr:peptidoglycan-binding protein [Clostridia bacterium]
MKRMIVRFAAMLLCLTLVLGILPATDFGAALAAGTYGKTTADGVFVRKKPASDAGYWFQLAENTVFPVTDTTSGEGLIWYKVEMRNPDGTDANVYIGYVSSAVSVLLTPAEAEAYELGLSVSATAQPVSNPQEEVLPVSQPDTTNTNATGTEVTGATGMITAGGVNFREGPSMKSPSMFRLERGVTVELLTIPASNDPDPWYKARYDNVVGYIMGQFVRVTNSGTPVGGPTATPTGNNTNYTATPTPAATVTGTPAYVRLVLSSANLRETPGGRILEQWVGTGSVLPVVGPTITTGGYTWYPVSYHSNTYYVRSDCVQAVYDPEYVPVATATPIVPVTPTPTPTSTIALTQLGWVRTTLPGVNLRIQPDGERVANVPRGVVLPYYEVLNGQVYDWYYVSYNGLRGYLRGDCVKTTDAEGNPVTVTATPAPSPTAVPVATVSPYGYVRITKVRTNLRRSAAGSIISTVDVNTVWPMTGNTESTKNYTWYPIDVNGTRGYVRGDCCYKLSAEQQQEYLNNNRIPDVTPDPNPTATPNSQIAIPYIITTADKVYIRRSASQDSEALGQAALGTILPYSGTVYIGGVTWYSVTYNNTAAWIMGTYVRVLTQQEYEQYTNNQVNTVTPSPAPTASYGYLKTTVGGVNVRTAPKNSGRSLGRIGKGQVLLRLADPVTTGNYTWYLCDTELGQGYLRGDCIKLCDADGRDLPVETYEPTATQTNTVIVNTDPTATATPMNTNNLPEASYNTLRLGSKGEDVRRLVAELKRQGYYTGAETSTYTSAVEKAVRKFQQAKSLEVDGIAGPSTQHALFGTVPIGTNTNNNLEMTLYPAEKIDWYKGGIQELWARGMTVKVYDVYTGIVWQARRWAGGAHADIEPLTAADTARLCQAYGVKTAAEIKSKNLWQRRPSLITIGNRTFACSLYGIPHNSDGDTIPDNDMTGQICMHFTNSRTHGSNKVNSYHTAAIQYAWENCPAGHK